jgi:hypothetical protein
MAAWGLDKWIRYPEARASQFGFDAPLWPGFVGFALLGTIVMVALFWTAARRVEAGEDLFAQRHSGGAALDDRATNGHPAPDERDGPTR